MRDRFFNSRASNSLLQNISSLSILMGFFCNFANASIDQEKQDNSFRNLADEFTSGNFVLSGMISGMIISVPIMLLALCYAKLFDDNGRFVLDAERDEAPRLGFQRSY